MDSRQATINEQFKKIVSEAMATSAAAVELASAARIPLAAAAAPPKPTEATAPMAAASYLVSSLPAGEEPTRPEPTPRPDAWEEALIARSLAAGSPAPADTQLATIRSTSAIVEPGDVGQPLRAPHPKEVERLKAYDGNCSNWRWWSIAFRRLLSRNAKRCGALRDAVEQLKGQPVEEAHEKMWWTELRLGPTAMEGLDGWKAQLNEFLESYTKGLAREIVDSRGQHGALDAWGSLKDRAESIREEHLQHYLLKAFNPKTAVAAKNLETTIAAWEADVRSYQNATGEKIQRPIENFSSSTCALRSFANTFAQWKGVE